MAETIKTTTEIAGLIQQLVDHNPLVGYLVTLILGNLNEGYITTLADVEMSLSNSLGIHPLPLDYWHKLLKEVQYGRVDSEMPGVWAGNAARQHPPLPKM